MALLLLRRKSSKEARRAMTKPGVGDGRCKRHPKHRQSPGVCSLCLRERLSQLNDPAAASSSSSRRAASSGGSSSASSLSSYYSSSSGSSCSSPLPRDYGNVRVSMSSLLFGSNNVNALKKSRSLARPDRANSHDDDRKSNAGFWSKLLNNNKPKDRDRSSLVMHSRTVRERSSVTERLGQQ